MKSTWSFKDTRIAELEKQVDYLYPFKESYSVLKEVSVAQSKTFAEILSKSNASLAELQDQIVEVKKQRDELLAALEQLVVVTTHLKPCPGTLKVAKDTIASVKGAAE